MLAMPLVNEKNLTVLFVLERLFHRDGVFSPSGDDGVETGCGAETQCWRFPSA